MTELRFDGRVALITGAGSGLGRAYALLLASRGASVVVNDVGSSANGIGSARKAADKVVDEIKRAGGKAIANYDSVEHGDRIIQATLDAFDTVHIVINNAGIMKAKPFANMSDEDWDLVHRVHLKGTYAVTKAAWPIMLKQSYGRIIMTSSDAGIYGLGGQSNFASSKLAMYGFGMTLAKEGAKKNVLCNVIAPVANTRLGSALFASSVPQSQLEALFKPELVAPMVAFLCHDASANTGGVYEIGGGAAAMVRRERGAGALLKVNDEGFTPGAVSAVFEQACDFREPVHPASITEVDWVGLVEKSMGLQSNPKGSNLRFENRVALVTGSGAGIGKAYAMLFAKYGAKVVINDISKAAADAVVEEIKRAGGDAFAVAESVENGQQIIDQVMQHYGRLDILVNNAGILRDKSFTKMTDREWDQVIGIHLYGTYKMTRAAWPIMMKQNYGRIINVSSAVGLYGNFGQANYSSAKSAIISFSDSLAQEGAQYGIMVNTIAPNAGTAMTRTILPEEVVDMLKPDFVAPYVGYLSHESCTQTGGVYEIGSGWCCKVRWQRSAGVALPTTNGISVEDAQKAWPSVGDFSQGSTYPGTMTESITLLMSSISKPPAKSRKAAEAPAESEAADLSAKGIFKAFKQNLEKLSAASRGNLVKRTGGIFEFVVDGDIFTIDLKNGNGDIVTGKGPKADISITVSENNFVKLATGKISGQKAYMQGLVKTKGSMMLAMKLDPVLKTLFGRPQSKL